MVGEWSVPEDEVTFRFTASGGPGGQHANRSNTKVEAVFDVDASPTMPSGMQRRVRAKLGPAVRVTVDEERSQHRNRQIALERLRRRVEQAARVPRRRRPTSPTGASRRRRLDAKRRRGEVKRQRRRPTAED